MMRSGNPTLSNKAMSVTEPGTGVMTINGTVNKTGILLTLVIASAFMTWSSAPSSIGSLAILGGIGGFILGFVTIFKKKTANITAPLYAVCQGWFLGAISSIFEAQYPGIVMQSVALTFGTLFCLLGAYKSGMIKVTENFKLGVIAATGGIALVYFLGIILSFFGVQLSIFGSGLMGIGFSLVVVGIAALNLVMDFDFIEEASEKGLPKYMEWYGAFGLIVTLIWLYMEILRLLSKLRDR